MGDYVLEMKNISKNFGGIQALTDVSLSLEKGEVLCLVGENGAGKSTLMKILTGVVSPTAGEIYIRGKKASIDRPIDAYHAGISIVHQELIQIPYMTVAENIFIGRYDKRLGFIDYKKLRKKTLALMERLGIHFEPNSLIKQYSVAQRQIIEIMKALSYDSSIIVFDEPTAALTLDETETLYRIIRQLKAEGISVIFISHRMDDIFAVGDRVHVLKDGRTSGIAPISEVDTGKIINMMIGREVGQQFVEKTNSPGQTLLEVRHLTNANVKDVSFDLHEGEILGLGGLIGAGRTELLRALFGIDSFRGEIRLGGTPIQNKSPRDAIRRGFSMVPEDRKDEGLLLNQAILQNIVLSILRAISRLGLMDPRKEQQVAQEYMASLSIRAPSTSMKAGMLSGGNQQKVVLAKCLAPRPKILLLDEPTRGVDVGAKAEIYKIINELATKGLAIIMVSSELPELIAVSDRIIVMHEGRVAGQLHAKEATEETIMKMAL